MNISSLHKLEWGSISAFGIKCIDWQDVG
jgi:hypothetical protein